MRCLFRVHSLHRYMGEHCRRCRIIVMRVVCVVRAVYTDFVPFFVPFYFPINKTCGQGSQRSLLSYIHTVLNYISKKESFDHTACLLASGCYEAFNKC